MSDKIVEIRINMQGRVIVRYEGGKCLDVTDTRGRKLYSAQAAQAQQAKPIASVHGWFHGECVIRALDPEAVLPAGMALYSQPQAQAGERKCSECGNGEPDLSLYCVRCLNNDHWHLIDPTQAGDGEAVIALAAAQMVVDAWNGRMTIELRDALDYLAGSVNADGYTRPQPAVNQQAIDVIQDCIAMGYLVETFDSSPTHRGLVKRAHKVIESSGFIGKRPFGHVGPEPILITPDEAETLKDLMEHALAGTQCHLLGRVSENILYNKLVDIAEQEQGK